MIHPGVSVNATDLVAGQLQTISKRIIVTGREVRTQQTLPHGAEASN
jgi:hypothetical protein